MIGCILKFVIILLVSIPSVLIADDPELAWLNTYSRPFGPGEDEAFDLTLSPQGNLYVTGLSDSTYSGKSLLTINYNLDGDTLWTRRYQPEDHTLTGPIHICTDSLGNAFVLVIANQGNQMITRVLKYSSAGDQEWIESIDSGMGVNDTPIALKVNEQGELYTLVWRDEVSTSLSKINLTKYSSAGSIIWTESYPETFSTITKPCDMHIDSDQNIVVTGSRSELDIVGDMLTIKFSPEGSVQWTSVYDGPDNGEDNARAITTGPDNHVYITGQSFSDSTDWDIVTIKYSPVGVEEWVARHTWHTDYEDAGTLISLDPAGYLIVAGKTNWQYWTAIKYDSSGVEEWVVPETRGSELTDMEIDDLGNIYLFGDDYMLSKYRPDGTIDWSVEYEEALWITDSGHDPAAMDVGVDGFIYLTGTTEELAHLNDYTTMKISPSGERIWTSHYNGYGDPDAWSMAIAIGEGNHLVATGLTTGRDTGPDITTIQYDTDGTTDWIGRYDQVENGRDYPFDVIVDEFGSSYIVGSSDDESGTLDFTTLKYAQDGTEEWIAHYSGPGDYDDNALKVVLDAELNLYVTGRSASGWQGHHLSLVTIK